VSTRTRPLPPLLLVGGAALVLLTALLGLFALVRVPSGAIGVAGGRLHEPGWHFKAPFSRSILVPLRGGPKTIDIDMDTPEGATIRVRLAFEYRLLPSTLAGRARDIETIGFEGLLERAARSRLERFDPGSLRAAGVSTTKMGRTPLSRTALDELGSSLHSLGIEPQRLRAWIGPPGAFSPQDAGGEDLHAADDLAGGPMPATERTGIRLLMIGLDGADWDIIDPLVNQGRMPHLAALIGAGTRARLRSYDPMISPLLWTTMVTGVGPDRHRIADFQAVDTATGRRVPITSRFRDVRALWNILGDAGLTSGFVAWWASYPAEKVAGFQVSNLVAYQTLRPQSENAPFPQGITYPPDYLERIHDSLITAENLTLEEIRGVMQIDREEFEAGIKEVLRRPGSGDESVNRKMAQRPVPLVLSILTGSRNYATIGTDLAARGLDLTAVYFEGIDMVGHRFQHCMPPRLAICPQEDFSRFRDTVTATYLRQDDLIGEILDAAGPDTTVLVVSDHGFKSGPGRPAEVLPFTTQQPVEWHEEEGIFLLSGPGARRGKSLLAPVTLFDLTPTILYLMGLPVADDMPGSVLMEAIDPDFARRHEPRTIPTYEGLGSPREIPAIEGPRAREAEEELLANLRALGYIGGDAGAAPATDDFTPARSALPESSAGNIETLAFYHRNLAIYFLKRREYASAAEELLSANARQRLPKTYQLLAQAYMSMHRTEDAIGAMHEGLEIFDTLDPETVLWLVRIRLFGPGGRAAAEEEIRRWADRTSRKPGLDDTIAGLLKEEAGDGQSAATHYRRSLEADPTRVVAAQRLYALEEKHGRAADLEPILRRGLEKDDRIDEYHNMLGVLLAESGHHEEASRSLRRAAKLDPYNARFANNLGSVLARLGRWEEAAATYGRAAELAPSSETYLRLGSVHRRLQQPDRALTAFERARDLGEGDDGAPILGIVLALSELNRSEEAIRIARERLDRHPDDRALQSLYEDLLRKRRTPGAAPGRSDSDRRNGSRSRGFRRPP
jgi:predicted AlkP superfamily phosphohydrolase/phosphomutase/tetratricopeptide (TPR) repeat protein